MSVRQAAIQMRVLPFILGAMLIATACESQSQSSAEIASPNADTVADDIQLALSQLPEAKVVETRASGLPEFVSGRLGNAGAGGRSAEYRANLPAILKLFRLSADELQETSVERDELGMTHARYQHVKSGLRVVGGDFVAHVNARGEFYAAQSTSRGDLTVSAAPTVDRLVAESDALASSKHAVPLRAEKSELLYFVTRSDDYRLAWEVLIVGSHDDDLIADLVYVDANSREVLGTVPQIHSIKRNVYDAKQTTTLPGSLARSEGQPAVADSLVNTHFDVLGSVANCYATVFNRTSYDNKDSPIVSTVHYGVKYNNAAWNPLLRQMYYGDGDGFWFANFAKSIDVVAHEFTHGVTSSTSNLSYGNTESGALSESFSDTLGASCESFIKGSISADTWKLGEDIYTPTIVGGAMRYLNDPVDDADGSIDYYSDYYDGIDPHYSSGIGNLAFYLASQGGVHPRSRSKIVVPAISLAKARMIWYRALTVYLTSKSNFLGARVATLQAAKDLYSAAEVDAVGKAWEAVGVKPAKLLYASSAETPDEMVGWYGGITCAADNNSSVSRVDITNAAPGGGTHAVRLVTGAFISGCSNQGAILYSPSFTATPGKEYIVEFYALKNSFKGKTYIVFYTGSAQTGLGKVEWRLDSGQFAANPAVAMVAPPGVTGMLVKFVLQSANATADIDLVRISVR